MLHIPALRAGKPYKSLDTIQVQHHRTHDPIAKISMLNSGLIARDLQSTQASQELCQRLKEFSVEELIQICMRASDHFMNSVLPLGDTEQSPKKYIQQLSGTTGLPEALCLSNMKKIYKVLSGMDKVVDGFTRGLDLKVLDQGYHSQDGRMISFQATTNRFGVVLPSNSPGVHTLWLAAIPLKTSLVLKPGRDEPWTPYRIIQSFIKAGCPEAVFNYFPCNHVGAGEILRCCDRSMIFGAGATVQAYLNDPKINVHGPGRSKIIIGEDVVDSWENFLDMMVDSILNNAGRSCVNTSSIWTPRYAKEISEAIADRLVEIEAMPAEHPESKLAAFASPRVAETISRTIDEGLKISGAKDVTAHLRNSERLVRIERCAYLLPTIIECDTPKHPLTNREFLFPFSSVISCPQNEILDHIEETLVVSAISKNENFIQALLASKNIDRLNIGPIPTYTLSWDQPHESNLFETLYRQRAFEHI